MSENFTRCPHCGIRQYENANADPILADSPIMNSICWKCAKPLGDA